MAGRHRDNSPSWRLPSAVGLVAVVGLVLAVWLSGLRLPSQSVESAAAVAAAPPPRDTNSTTSSTTTSETTTTTTTTTTTEPSTTRETTSTRPTTTPPPRTTAAPATRACSTALAGTRPHVAQVGNHLTQRFAVDSVGGAANRSGGGDHPAGLALDLMVDTTTGNNIASYVLAHRAEFGVKYVIWRQRINMGNGWSMMENRGSATANHYDHVHISFHAGADVSVSC